MNLDRAIFGCYAAIAACLTIPLIGCSAPDANANGRLAVNEIFRECADVEAAPEFEGRSLASLEDELGESGQETRFRLGSGVPEFRVELLNQFPVPENADREIVEQTWFSNHCLLTVWSTEMDGQIVSVDSLRYHDTADF